MYEGKKICAFVEARMTSSRLPGKVLMDLAGKPALQHIIERLRRSTHIDDIVVATTVNDDDDPIIQMCNDIDCHYYRGSEDDVLLRVLKAAEYYNTDIIVEITGDCPVVDWRIVDRIIELFFDGDYDYASNVIEISFPIGFDVQVFPLSVLQKVNQLTQSPVDHEHVSLYIYTHPEEFKIFNWKAEGKLYHPEIEITLDERKDYEFIKQIFERLIPNKPDFSAEDVIDLLESEPALLDIVKDINRKDAVKEQKDWIQKKG